MKKTKLTQQKCVELLDKWKIDWKPQYRAFTCAGCGQEIEKAWHIHCLDGGYKREFHLCDKCGENYDMSGAI